MKNDGLNLQRTGKTPETGLIVVVARVGLLPSIHGQGPRKLGTHSVCVQAKLWKWVSNIFFVFAEKK